MSLVVDIVKRLGDFELQAQLEAEPGIWVLFGPSGAGKSMTLHAISGLLTPSAGLIALDGDVLFRRGRPDGADVTVPARRRRIGHVFQSYALFPHLSVLDNVAFSLWPQRARHAQARALLEQMRLGHLAGRFPHQISGGQQQRVAIARALAARPRALLLDEPFSAVDAAVRERLQADIVTLQRALGLVVLYVTHDLEDAFVMGDRLAVVRDGRVTQAGPVAQVLAQPQDQGTAAALGIRNLLVARVVTAAPGGLRLDWDGLELEAPPAALAAGAWIHAYIRPDAVKLIYPDRPLIGAVSCNRHRGTVLESRVEGRHRLLRLRLANSRELRAELPPSAYLTLGCTAGAEVEIAIKQSGVVLLPGWGDARAARGVG